MEKEFYTVSELVEIGLGSSSQIHKLIKLGELKANNVALPGANRNFYRISREEIKRFLGERDVCR